MKKRDLKNEPSRRSYLKSAGFAGSAFLAALPAISTEASSEPSPCCGGGGGDRRPSVQFTSSQEKLVESDTLTMTTTVENQGTFEQDGGRRIHVYRIVSEAVQTNNNDNKVAGITAHEFQWDARNSPSNVDYAQDDSSPFVGVSPSPTSGSAPQSVYETLIEETADVLSSAAGTAISSAFFVGEIVNHISNIEDDPNYKRWMWNYGPSAEEKICQQMDPIFREGSDGSTCRIRSVADSLGNRIFFHFGDTPDTSARPTDPSDGVSSTDAESTADTVEQTEDGAQVLWQTPGLEEDDFYSPPPATDMTRNERHKFGVRQLDASENVPALNIKRNDVIYEYHRFPITIAGQPVDIS